MACFWQNHLGQYEECGSAGWHTQFSQALWTPISSPTYWETSTTCYQETGVPPGYQAEYAASTCELEPTSTIVALTNVTAVRVTFTLGAHGGGYPSVGEITYSGETDTSIADGYLLAGEYIVEFAIGTWTATSNLAVTTGIYPPLRITNVELYY